MLNPFLLRRGTIDVDILTFNYTETIEKIIGEEFKNLHIGDNGAKNAFLRNIEHIHQRLGNSLILGVNDVGQIENKAFLEIEEIVEVLVKPKNNIGQGHGKERFCATTIANANLIVVFGTSIGDTDKIWWEQVGNRIGDSCSVILFDRGGEVAGEHVSRRPQYKRKIRDGFLTVTGLDEAACEAKRDYVYVALTDEYFNLRKSK